MAAHRREIARLCQRLDTRDIANGIYLQATQLTGPGSGHDLGDGRSALPAICAFLASERLGNDEVREEQARAAGCSDPKIFEATLTTVRELVSNSASKTMDAKRITHRSLVKHYGVRDDAEVAMMEVEDVLNKSGAFVDNHVDPKSTLVQCVIFYWVCGIFKVSVPESQTIRQLYKLSARKWTVVHGLILQHCSHMMETLARYAQTAAVASAARTTRSQSRTPNRKILFALPNDLALSPSVVEVMTPKSGRIAGMKRKASADLKLNEYKTPPKRAKESSLKPTISVRDLSTHTPKSRRGNVATFLSPIPSAVHNQADDAQESEVMPTETIVVRSTRALHNSPKMSPWDAQHPTAAVVQSKHSANPTPLDEVDSVHATPMTSTGISDVFSSGPPSRNQTTRSQTRVRFRSVPSISPDGLSSEEEQEMPRRRRRNLRAPFLDHESYAWKPSPRTGRVLELARKWEAFMIEKHGDPWQEM